MSLGHNSGKGIPVQTARIAWASNPRGTPAMWVRDRLEGLFTDEDFADWYPSDGRRGLSPARLALVSVLQFAENLPDRQAAQAVRCRIDWKYALGMELTDPGFAPSVLSEFRDRMAEDDRADRLLAVMVDRLVAAGLVKRRGRQRTDSTHVLAAVRRLSRVELVAETLRAALEEVSLAAEGWLAQLITPEWVQRYGRPVRYDRLPAYLSAPTPVTAEARQGGSTGTPDDAGATLRGVDGVGPAGAHRQHQSRDQRRPVAALARHLPGLDTAPVGGPRCPRRAGSARPFASFAVTWAFRVFQLTFTRFWS